MFISSRFTFSVGLRNSGASNASNGISHTVLFSTVTLKLFVDVRLPITIQSRSHFLNILNKVP